MSGPVWVHGGWVDGVDGDWVDGVGEGWVDGVAACGWMERG